MSDLLQHALGYAGLGLAIFPVNPRDKRPLHTQHDATTDLSQLEAWWERWPDALIGHRIAPDALLLDVDPRHGGLATWQALKADPRFNGAVPRTHFSGRGDGGGHVWFERPPGDLTITKLDAWAKERGLGQANGDRWSSGIDILRHEHRYTILPPSPHPKTGKPYRWAKGRSLNANPAKMPAFLAELLTRDEAPTPEPAGPQWQQADSIADWFSANHRWADVLERHGWQLVSGDGDADGSEWRHPEATSSVSATVRHGCLFVYSTNTPFTPTEPDDPHGYTRFAAWSVLEHAGDQRAAGRAARGLKGNSRGQETTENRSGSPADTSDTRLVVTPLSEITVRRVRWLYDGRLAIGTLGLLAGREGLGKSTVATTLAADVTHGTLPGEYYGTPKAVIVCATEDSFEHTITPRFIAAGADLSKVYRVESKEGDDSLPLPLSLPEDIGAVEGLAIELDAALLIMDPLVSRLDVRLDTHKDGPVRQALEPLVAMADRSRMAIIGLIHFNKTGTTDPLDRIMASKAFTAVSRSVHTIIPDPDDEEGRRRYYGTPKNNLGPTNLPSLAFTIEPFAYDTDDGPGSTGKVAWQGESDESVRDMMRREQDHDSEKRSSGKLAVKWLSQYLKEHGPAPVLANDAYEAGSDVGHHEKAIQRAAKALGVARGRDGFQGPVTWRLPDELA